MTREDRGAILEEEIIILRNSGEIPEIALHSSLYYLEEDNEGPQINLQEEELHLLYDAALERAQEIVLRDLDPANRNLSIYRGPARSITNWYRLKSFCKRINRTCPGFDKTVSSEFFNFLQKECEGVKRQERPSSVNCSVKEIELFCAELHISPKDLPEGWTGLCCD